MAYLFSGGKKPERHVDRRIILFRAGMSFLLIVAAGALVKFFLFDLMHIGSDHMSPAVTAGDRILVSKWRSSTFLQSFVRYRRSAVVVFRHPVRPEKNGCLRIAGLPGDSVRIVNGTVSIVNKPAVSFPRRSADAEILPREYSPRDNFAPFAVPMVGDSVRLDSAGGREILFYYSMIRQEYPEKRFHIKPLLYINDSLTHNYMVKNFYLYQGSFQAIPDSFLTDWFFWDRLQAFLSEAAPKHKISISFQIYEGNDPKTFYRVGKPFYFLIADEWYTGYDSRYFGPVCSRNLKGSAVTIVWSMRHDSSGIGAWQWRRIGKLL